MQMLIVKQPEGEMLVFDLYGEDVSIGRDRAQDMQLAHQSVSRDHAMLTWENGIYGISDNGSHNGVFINGNRIESRSHLKNGDVVQIGHFELIYLDGQPPRRFAKLDIHSLQRWYPLGSEVQDNSTRHLSSAQMQRLLGARRFLEGARLVAPDSSTFDLEDKDWVIGRRGDIPISGWFFSSTQAAIHWNGQNHVVRQMGRFRQFRVNGQKVRSCTLEPGDTITIGKHIFCYEVLE